MTPAPAPVRPVKNPSRLPVGLFGVQLGVQLSSNCAGRGNLGKLGKIDLKNTTGQDAKRSELIGGRGRGCAGMGHRSG